MKRPVGVILTSIVLGLMAAVQLLSVLGSIVAAFGMRHLPATMPGGSPTPPVPTGLVIGIMVGYAIVFVLLAAWAIATLVGLVQLKNWARISVLVIGGCLVALGGMMIFGVVIVAVAGANIGLPKTLPPHTMQVILVLEGIMFAGIGAIGVWWLVYFNLRTVKASFVPQPAHIGYGYPVQPPPFPGVLPPPPGYPPAIYPPPMQYLPPHQPGRFSHVPWPVMVLACLFFVSAVSCLGCMLLPFPVFLGGFVLGGVGGHLFYVALGILTGALGWGLIRLDNWARLVCYGLLALGIMNLVAMMTPWYQARMAAYLAGLYGRMGIPNAAAAANLYSGGPILVVSAVFGVMIYGLIAWVLYHYRAAFAQERASAGL